MVGTQTERRAGKRMLTIPALLCICRVRKTAVSAGVTGGTAERRSSLKVFQQLGIIFGICLISDGISRLLPFPLPVSIIGMLLLLALLTVKAIKTEQIETTADFFLGNLPFFFVPAIVGLINYLDLLRDNAVKMLIVGMGTMVITFGVTVWTVRLTTALMERGKK